MPLPNLSINPYVTPYTPGPGAQYDALTERRIADYDIAAEQSDVLAYQNDALKAQTAPFAGDQAIADTITNNTRKQIQEWAAKGDYENMNRAIRKGARDFAASAEPLLNNQKRYSTYLSEMQQAYEKGDFGLDTYTKAKAASLSSYKGLDPNNISGSYFNGFKPSKDINVSEKVDKYLKDWKENGGTKFVMSEDGSYKEINWESAKPEEIAQAAQEALFGDSEFTGYATTQGSIGNHQRVNQELQNAIRFGAEKYGFYKEKGNLGFIPEYAFNNKKALEFVDTIHGTNSSATINPNVATGVFDGLDIDKTTGKLTSSPLIEKRNGKFYKYTKNGEIVPHSAYSEAAASSAGVGGRGHTPEEQGFKEVEITPQEAAASAQGGNERLVSMAADRYAREQIGKNISKEGYGHPKYREDWLKLNRQQYDNPKYLEKTLKEYEEARRNSQVIGDNQRYDISLIPGASTQEFTALSTEDALTALAGQSIGILDATEGDGGFRKGQRADINSMLDKYAEKGFVPEKFKRNGPLKYNPFSDKPGLSYSAILKNKETGAEKVVEFAVATDDRDLQTVQDVNKLVYSGLSGTVPFKVPAANGSVRNLNIRVTNGTEQVNGKRVFSPMIEIVDDHGNRLGDGPIPHNQLGEVYMKAFAQNTISKYLNPKLRAK